MTIPLTMSTGSGGVVVGWRTAVAIGIGALLILTLRITLSDISLTRASAAASPVVYNRESETPTHGGSGRAHLLSSRRDAVTDDFDAASLSDADLIPMPSPCPPQVCVCECKCAACECPAWNGAAPPLQGSSSTDTGTSSCSDARARFRQHINTVKDVQYPNIGIIDSEWILPALLPIHERMRKAAGATLSIDVGANLGDTSTRMMDVLASHACRAGQMNYCNAYVDAFEPLQATHAMLQEKGTQRGWTNQGWRLHAEAVSNFVGTAQFYGDTAGGNQQASLGKQASYGNAAHNVPVTTVDAFMQQLPPERAGAKGFLLKIDAEGFDPLVLAGAEATLRSAKFQFVQFEYNSKWFMRDNADATLRSTTQLMLQHGYRCYFMTMEALLPMYGTWWDDAYEVNAWSNAFCGRVDDVAVTELVAFYNSAELKIPRTCA